MAFSTIVNILYPSSFLSPYPPKLFPVFSSPPEHLCPTIPFSMTPSLPFSPDHSPFHIHSKFCPRTWRWRTKNERTCGSHLSGPGRSHVMFSTSSLLPENFVFLYRCKAFHSAYAPHFLIHSSVQGPLGCFYVPAIVTTTPAHTM